MKTRARALGGTLLVLPTLFFVSSNLLNDMGVPFLYETFQGVIRAIDSPFVILGGLFAGLALNLVPMLRFSVRRETETLVATVLVRPIALNLAVVGVSLLLLGIITVYLVGENLHHVVR